MKSAVSEWRVEGPLPTTSADAVAPRTLPMRAVISEPYRQEGNADLLVASLAVVEDDSKPLISDTYFGANSTGGPPPLLR